MRIVNMNAANDWKDDNGDNFSDEADADNIADGNS